MDAAAFPGSMWPSAPAVPTPDLVAVLVAPAAVRIVDLDAPPRDLRLWSERFGIAHRSLLAVARLGGEPLGAVAVPVGASGQMSGARLAEILRRELEPELRDGLARRGDEGRGSLCDGVPGRSHDPRASATGSSAVSVVVTTSHDPMPLERCVRSILDCGDPGVDVIVVENRPRSQATRRMLDERFQAEPRLRYVEEAGAGVSRARNAGLAHASGDVVMFTGADAVVDPGWIRRCGEAFERDDGVACVTGLVLPAELETHGQLLSERFVSSVKGFGRQTFRLPHGRATHPFFFYTPGVMGSGANTALRADVARQLGGFDPTLGPGTPTLGGEDLDVYVRLLQAGHTVEYDPSVIVWQNHADGLRWPRRQVLGHGVAMGAALTKQLVAGPERRALLRAVPAGVRYDLAPSACRKRLAPLRAASADVGQEPDASARPDGRARAEHGRRLDWLWRLGIALGPAACAASAVRSAPGRWSRRWTSTAPPRTATSADPPPTPTRADRALVAAAVALCLVAPAAVAVGVPGEVRLPAVLAFLCLAPGVAIVTALGNRAPTAEPGLVVGASLGVAAVVAQTMVWLGAWWPKAFLYLLAAACLVPLLARLREPDRAGPAREHGRARALASTASRFVRSPAAAHVAVLAAAGLAWGLSLRGADLNRMGGLGLLQAMPATYFVAFGLLLAGFTAAVSRPVLSSRLLWLYAVALILVLHATTALLYDEPRYTWTYKHLGVIAQIAQSGAVDRSVDIYNNWPGLFALAAWLSAVTGVSAISYAAGAQVFFNLVNVAALRFALRGLTNDERLIWTAILFFLLGNWLGQDYLAPQAFAFALSLVVLGLCLRWGPGPRPARSRAARWSPGVLERVRRAVVRRAPGEETRRPPEEETRRPAPLSPAGAVVVGGLCYLAVLVSHQLTPVIVLVGVTGLALIARRVPLWIPVAMGIAELWWLWRGWPYVSAHFSLFDPAPQSSAAPTGYSIGDGLPGLELVAYAVRAEAVILVVLAAVGLVRRLRQGRWDLAAAILIGAPLVVVALQSYSGEGRYRAYLFALPWLSFLAAAALSPARARLPRLTHRAGLALASAGLGICLLLAYFGLELINRVDPDDVAAAVWFERHAPRDSVLAGMTGGFPNRVTARYAAVYYPPTPGNPSLSDRAVYGGRLGAADLPRIENRLRSYEAPHTFLTLTASQEQYARLYGLLPAGSLQSLAGALRASPDFRLVYRRGSSSIFEYGSRRAGSSEAIR